MTAPSVLNLGCALIAADALEFGAVLIAAVPSFSAIREMTEERLVVVQACADAGKRERTVSSRC
jgi:hypothetical protein